MTKYIILDKFDVELLNKNTPVLVIMDDVPFVVVTEEYWESRKREDKE